jgi:hypothetical protein
MTTLVVPLTMTMAPPLLSLLCQSRTELKSAEVAGQCATMPLVAARVAYNWCACAFVGMKKSGGSCNVA